MKTIAATLLSLILVQSGSGPSIEIRDVASEQAPAVHVILRVTDESGSPVAGLTPGDFTVFENGNPVDVFELRQSHPEEEPVAVSFAIDTSGSMTEADIAGAAAAVNSVLDSLAPEDVVEIVSFNTEISVVKEYGDPLDRAVLSTLTPMQDTKLNDMIIGVLERMSTVEASSKALILLTDGVDDGSWVQDEAILEVLGSADVTIHSVGLGEVDGQMLEALAATTAGSFRRTADASGIAALYAEIASSLRTEYRLSYESTAAAGDHDLTIVANVQGSEASASVPFTVADSAVTGEGADSTGGADEDSSGDGLPLVLILVVAIGAAILGLLGLLFASRRGAQRQASEAVSAAPAVAPVGGASLSSSYHLVGNEGVFPVSGPTVIGRDPRADIIVDHETVSRSHAQLTERDGGLLVVDLGSANGTTVNGQVVSEWVARPGDVVAFGDLTFELRGPG